VAKPSVFIPVFPGTNCEYDTALSFQAAGADTKSIVFKNMTEQNITDSVDAFEKAIRESQILMADLVPVMSRMVRQNSLPPFSVMKRLKMPFMNC